jgi:hypothetical protein
MYLGNLTVLRYTIRRARFYLSLPTMLWCCYRLGRVNNVEPGR